MSPSIRWVLPISASPIALAAAVNFSPARSNNLRPFRSSAHTSRPGRPGQGPGAFSTSDRHSERQWKSPAEIGLLKWTGGGYYAQRLAGLMGPAGKVFAEDIADHAIEDWFHQRMKAYHLRSMEVVKGDIASAAGDSRKCRHA